MNRQQEDLEFSKLIKTLVAIQFLLESLDECKNTKIYRSNLLKWAKKLEFELKKSLGSNFPALYLRDEKSFSVLIQSYENITKIITEKFSLSEIAELPENLIMMKANITDSVNLSKDQYIELKDLYTKAKEDNKDTFMFQNREVATGYAKYLIEYLKTTYEE